MLVVLTSSAPPVLELFKDRVSSSFSTSSSTSTSAFTVVLRRNSFGVRKSSLLCCCSSKLKFMADNKSVDDEKDKIAFNRENEKDNHCFRSRAFVDVRYAQGVLRTFLLAFSNLVNKSSCRTFVDCFIYDLFILINFSCFYCLRC